MSCRVLGRGLERFAMHALRQAAQNAGIRRIVGVFRPTSRNGLVANLYPELGFERIPTDETTEQRFVCDLESAAPPLPHQIAAVATNNPQSAMRLES